MPDRPQELDFSSDEISEHLPVLREEPYDLKHKRAVDFTDDAVPQHIPLPQERAYDQSRGARQGGDGWPPACSFSSYSV